MTEAEFLMFVFILVLTAVIFFLTREVKRGQDRMATMRQRWEEIDAVQRELDKRRVKKLEEAERKLELSKNREVFLADCPDTAKCHVCGKEGPYSTGDGGIMGTFTYCANHIEEAVLRRNRAATLRERIKRGDFSDGE